MQQAYQKKLLVLVLLASLIRMFAASSVELGNDEVYYWTYAQKLQWNYFDHAPMVAIWIRIFTVNLLLQNQELFIRLGSIVSAAFCSWIIYQTLRRIHSPKAGWIAACLYTASLYASVISGLFIMPDSPQMLFWCAAIFCIAEIDKQPERWKYWVLFGLATGFCIMSKVHGIFLWIGLGLYIIFQRRAFLKLPQLYISALIAAVIAVPILLWNINNDFITYTFHSERVTVNRFALNATGFARELFGQIFYNNPVNVYVCIAAFFAWKRRTWSRTEVLPIYAWIGLPMIALLIGISLFRNTFPHWSGPAHVTLLPIAAIYLADRTRTTPRVVKSALVFSICILLIGLTLINFWPGTLGKKENEEKGKGDFTLDMYGWRDAGKTFASIRTRLIEEGKADANTPLVSHKWFPAAHEDYYFARPLQLQMVGAGSLFDLHHYVWMNSWRSGNETPEKAWVIVPSNEMFNVKEQFAEYYSLIEYAGTLNQKRSGETARYFYVYLVSGKTSKQVPAL